MSKKDFSDLLQSKIPNKVSKYNHYKPFHDPTKPAELLSGDAATSETDNKVETNRQQSDNKTEHKLNTNRTQTEHRTEHKLNTKWTQTEHKKTIDEKTEHKLNTELNTQLNTKWTQTEHKLNTKTAFSSLIGLQRELMIFIYNECKIARSKTTKNLSVEHISSALKVPRGSIKTTIIRLEKKGFVARALFKNGRGGWAAYSVPDFLFQELLQYETEHKLNTKWTQTEHKLNTELNTELNTAPPVVSSSYINTTTNLGLDIPKNWEGISIDALEHIGFSKSHLVQIYRQYEKNPEGPQLSPELIQSSIDAFAFDLKYNNTENDFKKEPAVVLLSLLKKAQPYNSVTPGKCVSPVQDALNKHQQMLQSQRVKEQQLRQQIKDTEFLLWQESLPETELLALCPDFEVPAGIPDAVRKTMHRKKALEFSRDYFDANIWAGIEQKILAKVSRKSIITQEEVVLAGV